jgi:Uma2 family endonuclease
MTVAEYLAFEAKPSDEKREFHFGEVLATSGATEQHSQVSGNLYASLHNKLRGGGCRPYNSDLGVQLTVDRFVYPDATLVCGEPEFRNDEQKRLTLVNPTAVFEVLSDSTRDYDRGRKFQYYRQSPSITEIFLIEQDLADVQGYLRQDDGSWSFLPSLGLDGVVKIRSAGIEIARSDLYENVRLREEDDE